VRRRQTPIHAIVRRRQDFALAGDTHAVPQKATLWTCPKGGLLFVGRNTWHACDDLTVE
jgi:hypothetical protein